MMSPPRAVGRRDGGNCMGGPSAMAALSGIEPLTS